MPRPSPMLAALWLLGACAAAPEPWPEEAPPLTAALGPTERYGPLIEAAAMALIEAEPPGALPRGLEVSVLSVEETATDLFYDAGLRAPRRGRDRDYVIYGQCAIADLAACAGQIVVGARMLAN